ncbi:MAG: PD-(D/E)XK nuclease-like domain-containing protein [Colwellia sp.]|nr:PD-(D/E)XK nuclease-like domain-containing protein [Colwellia sp.]
MTLNIRTLPEGEKITDPGFYNISLDRHHHQPCDGVSVTSGVLRTMEKHGPSKVWATHALNPNRYERKQTDALRLGSAMAAFIEGGLGELGKMYQVLPEDRPQRATSQQLTAIKEGRGSKTANRSIAFWREIDSDPRDNISQTELTLIAEMGLALSNDPSTGAVLGGVPEITMAHFDERTQLWFLARPDNVHPDGSLSDYKKVSTQGRPFTPYLIDGRVEDHGYDMQMGFAAECFEALTGVWSDQCGLVFQEDTAPYDAILRPIPEEDLRIGQFLNRQAAIRFRECLDADHWPGPGEHIAPFHRREDARVALLERMQTAGVAP